MALSTLSSTLLFPAFAALAARTLLNAFLTSDVRPKIEAQCPPNSGPYNLPYTALPQLNAPLCFFATFFHTALASPAVFPLLATFGASWAPLVILPTVEASRKGRARVFGPFFPVVFGLVYQLAGVGVLFPLFFLAMVASGHARMHTRAGAHASVDQAHAEANLFALVVGYIAPSVAMCVLEHPTMTLLWLPFPVWIALSRALYLLLRPLSPSPTSSNGHNTVQATFLLTFVLSALTHIQIVWSLRSDLSALASLFIPRAPAADAPLEAAVLGLLQWDMYFTIGAGMLGSLWFVDDVAEGVRVCLWCVGASLVVGPGAAAAGLFMWREGRLKGGPEKVA